MDEIQRLLRVASGRNKAGEYMSMKFRLLKTLNEQVRAQLEEDRITPNVLLEAVLRGYVNRHPAVMAMVDQWIRDEVPEREEPKVPALSKKDLNDIYSAAGSGMVSDEE